MLKLNIEERERELKNSSMVYSLKANFILHNVAFTPCQDCPFKNENPTVSILEKDKSCFERCPFEIMIWILNEDQTKIYQKFRPQEKKERELKKAIREGKIIK